MSTGETMSVVEHSFYDAVLADIVYINIDGEATGKPGFTKGLHGDDLAKLIEPELTEPLAAEISKRFIVLDVKNDSASGYQGVLFKDTISGDVILANRGTDPSDSCDIKADVDLAALSGVAQKEITSMVNWWNDISKPAGTTYTSIVASPLLSLSTFSSGETKVATGGAVAGEIATAVANHQFRVVGHSLGGHLTTVFASLFHDQVSASSTFNGAGIDSTGVYATNALNQLMKDFLVGKPLNQLADILDLTAVLPQNTQSNYYAENGFSLTTNDWAFSQIGTRIGLENEQSAVALWQNHSMYKLTDLLAVYAALDKLQSNSNFNQLNELTKTSSNQQVNSIENLLDSVRRLLGGMSISKTPAIDDGGDWEANVMPQARIDLHTNLNNLTNSEKFKALVGKLKIETSPVNLDDQARTDFSAFLSLFTLSPITLTGVDAAGQSELIKQLTSAWQTEFNQWQADAAKADSDRVFTDAYLHDRAAMLSWVVLGNLTDASSTGNQTSVTAFQTGTKSGLTYTDTATNSSVAVTINSGLYQEQYDDSRTRELHSVSFGGAGNDRLSGERQYGGAGDDILQGSTAASYLEGGNGNDTYQLVSGSHCTIVDCDGKGVLQVDGKAMSGVFSRDNAYLNFYYSADKNYRIYQNDDGTSELAVKTTTSYINIAKLEGWSDGDFGITLITDLSNSKQNTLQIANKSLYLTIDASASSTDTLIYGGDTADSVRGSGHKDEIHTGDGSSFVLSWGGDDQIYGGKDNDFVISGGNAYPSDISDNDIVMGGGGSDILSSGGGDDFLYGNTDDRSFLNETADSTKTGDWLSGGKGNDFLNGSDARDALLGGSENDTIYGGAGNDLILGDSSYMPTGNYGSIYGPTVFSCIANYKDGQDTWTYKTNDPYNTLTVVSGNAFKWQWGVDAAKNITLTSESPLTNFTTFLANRVDVNAGDDYLDGGKGNDWIAGQAGNDTLLGGDGDDILYGDDAQTLNWGVEGNDKIYTGAGIDYAYGGGGNDIINATDPDNAQDWLYGGAGDDILFGGTGKDQLQGDVGNDDLYAGTDDSTLLGGEGNDYLVGDIGNDDMQGGTGSDFYASSSGTDVWTDESGSDVYQLSSIDFTGAAKTTIIDTDGLGVILIDGINLTGQEVKATSQTTWSATSGLFNLTLSNSDLVVTFPTQAASGQAIIQGFVNSGSYLGIKLPEYAAPQPTNHAPTVATAIADQAGKENIAFSYVVPANTFADSDSGETLTFSATLADGSALPLWIKFDAAARTFTGTPLSGNSGQFDIQVTATDPAGASVSDSFALRITSETIKGSAGVDILSGTETKDKIYGLAGDDTLIGNSGNDVLNGGAGADMLIGGVGDDTYYVDNADDAVTENANEGTDTIRSAVTYTLGAHVEKLTLTGTAAINGTGNELNNNLYGNGGNNTLTGLAGNDVLNGGAGADMLIGGVGDDTYYVDNADDAVTENANEGTDTIRSAVTYTLGAHVEKLTLTGTAAINGTGNELNNNLYGNDGNNTLTGLAGNDVLNGGAGADILIGGTGKDTLKGGVGNDTYLFGKGDGQDVISDYDTTSGNIDVMTLQDITADQLWFTKSGNNLDISVIGTTDKMTVQSWYSGNAYHVEQFKSSDGKTLLDSQVANLVSAMASMTPPTAGQTTLPQSYQDQLAPVLAANWK